MTRDTMIKKMTLELIAELKSDPELIYNQSMIMNKLDQAMTIGAEQFYEKKKQRANAKPVFQFTKDDVFIKRHPSITDASRTTKANVKGIIESCNDPLGKRKSGGNKWKYEL